MEEQENEQQEKGLGEQIVDVGKNKIEQAAKDAVRQASKKAGQAAMKALLKVLPIILPKIIIISVIIAIVGVILGGATTYVAKQEVAKIGSELSEKIMSSMKMGDNGPVAPSKEEMIAQIDEKLEEIGIKKSDLEMGSESQANDYLYQYALSSLSTQLPYIDGSQVQGIVKIKRSSSDGTIKNLTFKKYSDFRALIDANDPTAVNYFAIDNNWQLCVAKHIKTTTTSTNGDETIDTVDEVKIPYQTMVSQYSVPFEFLLVLQQISLNPEYVSKVADLVSEQGEIELTIFDSKETRQTEYTYTYVLNNKVLKEKTEEHTCEGTYEHIEGSPSNLYYCNVCGNSGWFQPRTCGEAIQKHPGSGRYICSDCGKDYGNKKPSITTCIASISTVPKVCGRIEPAKVVYETLEPEEKTETSTTVSEINTVTANITKANVWVIEQTAQYTQNNPDTQYTLGEDGTTIELDDEEEPQEEGEWKTEQVETRKETINKTTWQVSEPNSSINPNKFLGLWRNSTGSYTQGAEYVSKENNGILVKYSKPSTTKKESPVANIINAKEMLYGLLENLENTQNHAQLMKYIIHYYETGQTLDIDLSIFNANEFTEITRVLGGTIQEKVWFSLKSAGFSDESIAGAMGNIHYESGSFDPTRVEGGYTEDNGGIGICQWTNNNRGSTGRNSQLKAYAASKGKTWQDEDIQVEFLLTEITGTGEAVGYANKQFMTTTYAGTTWQKTAWEEAEGTTTDEKIEYATKAFCYTFERPKEKDAIESMSQRIEYAKMYYKQFAGSVIRYYQDDYADVAYGSSNLAKCGCGPTCFAMVATHLSGETITPPDAVAWCGNAYYAWDKNGDPLGTSWTYFNAAAKHFALPRTVKQVSSFSEVENALQTGKLVISSQGPGLFTSSGHFIVLTRMENGLIYVNDPNKKNAVDKGYNDRAFTVSEITQAAKQYWIFE